MQSVIIVVVDVTMKAFDGFIIAAELARGRLKS